MRIIIIIISRIHEVRTSTDNDDYASANGRRDWSAKLWRTVAAPVSGLSRLVWTCKRWGQTRSWRRNGFFFGRPLSVPRPTLGRRRRRRHPRARPVQYRRAIIIVRARFFLSRSLALFHPAFSFSYTHGPSLSLTITSCVPLPTTLDPIQSLISLRR